MKNKKILLLVAILFSFINLDGISSKNSIHNENKKSSITAGAALVQELTSIKASHPLLLLVALQYVDLFCHEFGHAITAYLLNPNSNPEVHFFTDFSSVFTHEPLLDLGIIKIHGNGILAAAVWEEGHLNETGELIALLGGPLIGILVPMFTLFASNFYIKYSEKKNFLQSIKASFQAIKNPFKAILENKELTQNQKRFLLNLSLCAFIILIEQVFYILTPNVYGLSGLLQGKGNGDGERLWERHLGLEEYMPIASIASAVCEWGLYGYLFIQYAQTLKELSAAQDPKVN